MPEPIVAQSPLLHPVSYQGETYFTSQYFHRQYRDNSPHGGKYRQHKNFLQLLRSIEQYQDHINLKNIAELSWDAMKVSNGVLAENFSQWKILFHATGFQPVTLLNAVAQAALSHHLDDTISRQLSVAINTKAARSSRDEPAISSKIVARELRGWLEIGEMLGTPLHIVQQEAAKQIEALK